MCVHEHVLRPASNVYSWTCMKNSFNVCSWTCIKNSFKCVFINMYEEQLQMCVHELVFSTATIGCSWIIFRVIFYVRNLTQAWGGSRTNVTPRMKFLACNVKLMLHAMWNKCCIDVKLSCKQRDANVACNVKFMLHAMWNLCCMKRKTYVTCNVKLTLHAAWNLCCMLRKIYVTYNVKLMLYATWILRVNNTMKPGFTI